MIALLPRLQLNMILCFFTMIMILGECQRLSRCGFTDMRIAYIAVKGIPIGGGIEKVTQGIGSRLVGRGQRVIVCSGRDYGTTEDGVYRGMEIRTVPSINTTALHKLSICFFCHFKYHDAAGC
ncbi:hypothetical protein PITCH_A1720007 [uncultured Desulfobacterium sp.]|uniref:Glycosyltransferase subfamily 4-like N-terminal domain-containing protein n=1 Tax=uncultured Desulfobacterium sp. TaxID=201089 RepID=A0A445MUR9_9BACT|nr:hypothetical protein PITCH_A1720007 [uncultured Desulfobacterium sp.]